MHFPNELTLAVKKMHFLPDSMDSCTTGCSAAPEGVGEWYGEMVQQGRINGLNSAARVTASAGANG